MCDYQLVSCSSYGSPVVKFWVPVLFQVVRCQFFGRYLRWNFCAVCPHAVLRCVSSFVRLFLLLFLVFVLVRGMNVPCFCSCLLMWLVA